MAKTRPITSIYFDIYPELAGLHSRLIKMEGRPRRAYAIDTRNPNHLTDEFSGFPKQHGLGFVLLDGEYVPRITQHGDRQSHTIQELLQLCLEVREAIQHAHQKGASRSTTDPSPEPADSPLRRSPP